MTVQPYDAQLGVRLSRLPEVLQDTAVWIKNSPLGDPKPYGQFGVMSSFPPGLFGSDPPLHTKLRGILEPLLDRAITTPRRSPGASPSRCWRPLTSTAGSS